MPNGQTLNTSFKALLPYKTLNPKARQCNILPGLQHNSLISVGKLSDAGYCTIVMPGNQGVQVVDCNKVKIHVLGEAALRGWRDSQGLWRVPLEDGNSMPLSPQQLEESLNNAFDLPSTEQIIRYLSTCLCWIPNQKDMDQGNQNRKLHRLAHAYCRKCEQNFPRIR